MLNGNLFSMLMVFDHFVIDTNEWHWLNSSRKMLEFVTMDVRKRNKEERKRREKRKELRKFIKIRLVFQRKANCRST
jgi:hypothetical protein